jgi:transcriptional regulator with XRE-family HTH domain
MTMGRNGVVPTPRGVFGGQLRRLRERAGLTQEQLASLIGYSYSTVAAIETGRRAPAYDAPERMDAALKTGDQLTGLAADLGDGLRLHATSPEWFRDWQQMETQATSLRWYEPLLIPGLLQTQAYTRAVLRTRVGETDEEIEEMMAARLERQAILERPKPPTLWVVIDEAVLRRPVGGPEVMAEQVMHLAEAARRPGIVVQVIPAAVGAHEGLRGSFVLMDFAGAQGTAWQDGAVRGQAIADADGIVAMTVMWDTLKSEALSRSVSLKLIEEAGKTWT